jgi:hypothetical protein
MDFTIEATDVDNAVMLVEIAFLIVGVDVA